MDSPKPVFSATISYRTPAGRCVLFGSTVAAHTLQECKAILLERLASEERFGQRRIGAILDDFKAFFIAMQACTPVGRNL